MKQWPVQVADIVIDERIKALIPVIKKFKSSR